MSPFPKGSGIVYSTRIADKVTASGLGGGSHNYNQNGMYDTTYYGDPSLWPWTSQHRPELDNTPRTAGGGMGNLYYSWLVGDTATGGPEAERPLLQYNGQGNLGINDLSEAGLVTYEGKAALQDELQEYLRASTDNGVETQIVAGLQEAELIFFGGLGSSVAPRDPVGAEEPDPVRRYVIFLTDGELGDETEAEFLQVAGRLKGAGVNIMTMAISTPIGVDLMTNPVELTDAQIDSKAYRDVSIKSYDAGSVYNVPYRDIVQSYATIDPRYAAFGTSSYSGSVATSTLGRTDSTTGDPASIVLGADALYLDYDWLGSIYGGGEYNYLPLMAYASMPLLTETSPGTWEPASIADYTSTINVGDDWEDVEKMYRPTAAGDMTSATTNGHKVDVANWNFEYIPSSDPGKIKTVFDEFVRKIVMMGEDASAKIQLSEVFDVYDMPGQPRFETNVGKVTQSGKNLVWDHEGAGVPLGGLYYLSFYVKFDKSSAQSGHSYSALTNVNYTVTGPFKTAANPTPDPITGEYPISTITKDYPAAYVSAKGEVEQDEKEPDLSDFKGPSGADQHKQNRQSAKDTANYAGNVLDIAPDISGLETGTGLNGRSKVSVKVTNGANMRYQWQVKNESGAWEDIFGATSSQYTLSAKFTADQDYELRCRITNAAGKITFTDSIKVTAQAATKGAGLQSK